MVKVVDEMKVGDFADKVGGYFASLMVEAFKSGIKTGVVFALSDPDAFLIDDGNPPK
jgi:hypothetical protein